MAIERDDKLLNGAGLAKYTELLKLHLDGVTTTIAGDITTAVTTAVNAATTALIGDATSDGDTLGKLEDRIESAESGLETVITEVFGEYPGVEPSRIDDLESDLDGVTTTISGMQDDIDGITTYIAGITETIADLSTTYKALQTAATFTAPAGSYISGIEQNEQGVVTATTTALPTVDNASDSTPGLVQMASDATTYVVYDTAQVDGIISGIEGTIDGITTTIDGITTTVNGLTTIIGDITTPLDERFKALQSAATLTAPAGEYISGITQDEQGVVAITTTALPTVPTASSTTPGLVTVVGVTNPTGTAYEVYSKEKIDAMLDESGGSLGNLVERVQALEGDTVGTGAKKVQAAVSSPAAGSTPGIEFIDTISQNANGDITATKQAVRNASAGVTGVVQMATGATTNTVMDATQVQAAIDQAVASFVTAQVVAADAQGLPDVASPEENVIYLVPNGTSTEPNYYIEYMWMDGDPDGKWEVVGNTELAIETLNETEIENIFDGAFNS